MLVDKDDCKSCDVREETEKKIGSFIFDESKIIKNKNFSQHRINKNLFGYGFLLPKEIDLISKKGDVVGKQQILAPVSIVSDKNLLEINKKLELDYKINYPNIPGNLELRWELRSIEAWLSGEISERIDGKVLFEKIKKNTYEKFMFFRNPVWYDINVLWDMGTYCFEIFNTYPIYELRGLQETAKSKDMKVSRLTSFNPTPIMINPSEATLFRETHEKTPTKYIDEAEKLFVKRFGKIESDNRVELINGSYSKGSTVPRVEKIGNRFITVYYNCYSPAKIGSINGLYGATESRCITRITTKASDKDERGNIEVEDFEDDLIYKEIRNELYIFFLQNWKEIEKIYKKIKIESLAKRNLQLWKPLLSIAKFIDKDLFKGVLDFAEKTSVQRKADFISEGSFEFKILRSISELVDENSDGKIYIQDIKNKFKLLYPEFEIKSGFNRTISYKVDNFGFKELRKRDNKGSYFEITKEVFDIIINPICPELSTPSTPSTQIANKEVREEDVV